jgi:immune inhibitor A
VKGDNQGMEFWSLMDSGNYNNNGYSPCAYTAWEREAMGWIAIPTLDVTDQPCEVDLKPIDDGGTAYRILNDNDETDHEYLIIENIQQKGINSRQRGHGMLMYHVNYEPYIFLYGNSVNNEAGSPRMTVVPADNLLFAQYNVGKTIDGKVIKNADFYAQLAGDPFPGASNQTECSDATGLVNFAPYIGESWNKAFQNIHEQNDGIITFTCQNIFSEGIKSVSTADIQENEFIYSVTGQRVGKGYKGVVICNGQKHLRIGKAVY